MQKGKNLSTTASVAIVAGVLAVIGMMYVASTNSTAPVQRDATTRMQMTGEENTVADTGTESTTEVAPAPVVTKRADTAVITSTLSELEEGFDESYDDSNIDASFEDLTGELTQTYDF